MQKTFTTLNSGVNIKPSDNLRSLLKMKKVFKRERNVTHERLLFYSRRQPTVGGNFVNAAETIRDIFIIKIWESGCHLEISRSKILLEKVYRSALYNERGERVFKWHTGKQAWSVPHMTIKQGPGSIARRGAGSFPKRGNAPVQRMQEIDGATIVIPQILHCSTMQTVPLKAERVLHAEISDTLKEPIEECDVELTNGEKEAI